MKPLVEMLSTIDGNNTTVQCNLADIYAVVIAGEHTDGFSVFGKEAAILESHGLEVQSPGAHSNSDDVEGTEFLEQVHNPCHWHLCSAV